MYIDVYRCILDGYDSYDTIEAGFHIWFWPDMIGFCPKKGPNDVSICLPSIAGQESLYCALVQWQVTWLQWDLCQRSKNGHKPKLWQSNKFGTMKKNPLDDIWHSHDAGWTHCKMIYWVQSPSFSNVMIAGLMTGTLQRSRFPSLGGERTPLVFRFPPWKKWAMFLDDIFYIDKPHEDMMAILSFPQRTLFLPMTLLQATLNLR